MSSHTVRTRCNERIRQRRQPPLQPQSSSSQQADSVSGPPWQHRSKNSSKQRRKAGPQRASQIHVQKLAQRARRARERGVGPSGKKIPTTSIVVAVNDITYLTKKPLSTATTSRTKKLRQKWREHANTQTTHSPTDESTQSPSTSQSHLGKRKQSLSDDELPVDDAPQSDND